MLKTAGCLALPPDLQGGLCRVAPKYPHIVLTLIIPTSSVRDQPHCYGQVTVL